MTKSPFLVSASLFLTSAIVSGANSSSAPMFKPGAWEITREVNGGPRKLKPQTDQYCITQTQLKSDAAAPLKTQPKPRDGQKGPTCDMGAASMANGKASFAATCKGPMGSMKLHWSGTYSATSFNMSGKLKMGFMAAKVISTGRHVGACANK